MQHQLYRRLRNLALTLVTVAVVGASPAAMAADPETVSVGIGTRSLASLTFQMLDTDREILAKHDLKAGEFEFLNQNNCITALIGGQIDVCQHATTNGIDAVVNGADLRVIAATTAPITELILSSKVAERLGVTENDPIDVKLKALKGLRISALGLHEATLDLMLRSVGMSVADDVEAMKLSDPLAMMEGIRNGQIDAALWSVGSLNDLVADKSGIRLISIPRGDFPAAVGIPLMAVFVRGDWYEANKEKAQEIHDSVVDAVARLKTDPAAATAVKQKWHESVSDRIWSESVPEAIKVLYDDGAVSAQDWATLLDMNSRMTKADPQPAAYDKMVAEMARRQ
ncbi:MAG: ABC transporter substrate-binding protein [Rhizobiaceae bacterium]|nr:ABC transporter substrate-binding protein [Rhizobiaceae bacterium]